MNSSNEQSKIKLLVASHIGEPVGGISVNYETLLASSLKSRVQLHFVETSQGNLNFMERGRTRLSNYLNAGKNVMNFLTALIRTSPDVIHLATVQNPSFIKNSTMIIFSRLLGKKVVVQPHCGFKRFLPDQKSWSKRYTIFILKQCQGVVVLSREWDGLKDILPEIPIVYVPNAIDVREYVKIERKTLIKETPINFLYFGHIGIEKGSIEIVEAARRLKNRFKNRFVVNFVGEGLLAEAIESIKQKIEEENCGDIIKLHPPEYRDAKMQRLSSSDVLLLPSYHEGMPMSIIEAMAAGMPVIASRVGGIPDLVIDGETGFLINPADVDGLCSAMESFISDPSKIYVMGQKGREVAINEFDIEIKVNRLVGFYQEILNHK